MKLAEIPPFAPNGTETKPYSLEEIAAMLKVLSEPSATAVAAVAFTGLRLGELRGLTWESFEPAQDEESLGWLNVTRSVWRSTVGDPKTTKSKAPVPVIPQLAQRLVPRDKYYDGGDRYRSLNRLRGEIVEGGVKVWSMDESTPYVQLEKYNTTLGGQPREYAPLTQAIAGAAGVHKMGMPKYSLAS